MIKINENSLFFLFSQHTPFISYCKLSCSCVLAITMIIKQIYLAPRLENKIKNSHQIKNLNIINRKEKIQKKTHTIVLTRLPRDSQVE